MSENVWSNDGLSITINNEEETRRAYESIFENHIYEDDSIKINDGDIIVDIGANIGLYPLYLSKKGIKDLTIYAFEPSRNIFDILTKNLRLAYNDVHAFQMGVSNKKGLEAFTSYHDFSIGSALSKNIGWAEKVFADNILLNLENKTNMPISYKKMQQVMKMSKLFLSKEEYECNVDTLSNIIEDMSLLRIDLLKINAENSEWDIISSVHNSHWDRIRQVIIEIHDENGINLNKIFSFMQGKGYACTFMEDPTNINSSMKIYLVYCIKIGGK